LNGSAYFENRAASGVQLFGYRSRSFLNRRLRLDSGSEDEKGSAHDLRFSRNFVRTKKNPQPDDPYLHIVRQPVTDVGWPVLSRNDLARNERIPPLRLEAEQGYFSVMIMQPTSGHDKMKRMSGSMC
jgi:hypothetical protein